MAKPDKKVPKDAQGVDLDFDFGEGVTTAEQVRENDPKLGAVEPDTQVAKTNVKAELSQEIYDMLKRGEYMPGYTIIPADAGAENPTVESVLLTRGADALVKLKPGVDQPYAKPTPPGIVRGEEAKALEQMGLTPPRA